MSYTIQVTYSEALVRHAVLAYWKRTVGIGCLLALALLAGLFAILVWRGERSWLVGVFGTVLVLGVLFIGAIYVVHLRGSIAKLRSLGSPVASLVLDDSALSVASALGTSTVQWSSIIEVWRFSEFWLVLFSKAQFITLPLCDVPPSAQEFIVARVEASGGKIVG